jgi:hypothetical protein
MSAKRFNLKAWFVLDVAVIVGQDSVFLMRGFSESKQSDQKMILLDKTLDDGRLVAVAFKLRDSRHCDTVRDVTL